MIQTAKNLLEYPKLLCMGLSCVLAYILFRTGAFDEITLLFHGYGYVTFFLAGILFSFGFTTPFAIGIFVAATHGGANPFLAAVIGGSGALIADLGLFEFARFSLHDELHRLKSTAFMQKLKSLIFHESLSEQIKMYLLWSIAGLVIASPLPDEIGVSLLGGTTNVSVKKFGILCFALNTIGIFVIISMAKAVQG